MFCFSSNSAKLKIIVRKRSQNVASFPGFVQFAEIKTFDHVSIFLRCAA